MNISILDMGKTKKRNVRESIISVLSREYPLSIRKIYNSIKKEYKLEVTYQAVFKLVKEMLGDGILENGDSKMEYKLNIAWIKQLEDEINVIKKKYTPTNIKEHSTQDKVDRFILEVAPKIKEYLGKDECCILGVSGGGKIFGVALWKYLLREGCKAAYTGYDPFKGKSLKENPMNKKAVENKKLIIIDSAIYSGRTYQNVMEYFNNLRKKIKIADIKYACGNDLMNLADFSFEKSGK